MEANEEGEFAGHLPSEGTWPVELEREGARLFLDPVVVEQRPGKTYAEVDIAISNTVISGTVVEAELPVPRALVTVLRGGDRLEKELFTTADDDGRFELNGLRAGQLQVRAAAGRLTSDWRFLSLEDGDEITDLELELAGTKEIRGRVSAQGSGVPGVRIVGFPSASSRRVLPVGGATGADGAFGVKVPRDVERVDLAVLAPGHEAMLALAQRAAGSDGWPLVDVQLRGEGGTVVLQTGNSSFEGSVSYGGATIPLRTFLNLMAQEGRVNHEEEHRGVIPFQGLAAGSWTSADIRRAAASRNSCSRERTQPST